MQKILNPGMNSSLKKKKDSTGSKPRLAGKMVGGDIQTYLNNRVFRKQNERIREVGITIEILVAV